MINNSFPLVAQYPDSSGNPATYKFADIPYDQARGQFNVSQLPDNGAHALTLPGSPCYQVYVKNIDPAATLTVNWTPNGAAQDKAQDLAPGGMMLLWDTIGGPGGVTGVSLTSSAAAGQPYEVFLGT